MDNGLEAVSDTPVTTVADDDRVRVTDGDTDDDATSDMPQLVKDDDHDDDNDTNHLDSGAPSPLPPQLHQEVPGGFSVEEEEEREEERDSTDEDSDVEESVEESSEDEATNPVVEDCVKRPVENVMVDAENVMVDAENVMVDAENVMVDEPEDVVVSSGSDVDSDSESGHSDADESDTDVHCSDADDDDGQSGAAASDVECSDDTKNDDSACVGGSEVELERAEHVSMSSRTDGAVLVTSSPTQEACSEQEQVVDVPTEHDSDMSSSDSSDYDDSDDADDEDAAMSPANRGRGGVASSQLKEQQALQCAVEAIAEDHAGGLHPMDTIASHDVIPDASHSNGNTVAGLAYGRSLSTSLGDDVVKASSQPVVTVDSVCMETLPASNMGSADASSIETANAVAALSSSAGFISTVDMVDVPQLGLASPTSITSAEMNASSVETTPPSQGFSDCAQLQQNTFCGSTINSSPGGYMEAVNPQLTSPASVQITSPQPPTPHTNQTFNMPNPSPSSNNANFNMPNPSPSNSSGFSIPNHSPSNNNASCAIANHSPSNNANNFGMTNHSPSNSAAPTAGAYGGIPTHSPSNNAAPSAGAYGGIPTHSPSNNAAPAAGAYGGIPTHSPSNNAAPAAGAYGGIPTHSPSNHGSNYGMPNPSPSNPSANFNMPNPSPVAATNYNMPNPSPGNSAPGSNYSMPTPSPTNSSHSYSMATPSPTGTTNTYTLQSQAMIAQAASAPTNFNMCPAAMHINNNYMQLLPQHNTQRLTHNVQSGSCAMLPGARSRQHKFQQVAANSSCSLAKLQQLTNGISDFIPENTMTPPPNLTPPPPVNMTPPPAALHRNMTPPDLMPQSYKQYQRRAAAAASMQKVPSAGNMGSVNPGMSFTPNVTIQPGTNMITGYNMQLMNGYRMPQPMNYSDYMANAGFVNQPSQLPVQMGMMNMYSHNFPQQMQQTAPNNAAAAAAMYSTPHGYTLSPQAFNVNMNGMMRR